MKMNVMIQDEDTFPINTIEWDRCYKVCLCLFIQEVSLLLSHTISLSFKFLSVWHSPESTLDLIKIFTKISHI